MTAGAVRSATVLAVVGCALIFPASTRARQAAVTEQSVRAHMSMLASDALNGRGSGTRDEWIAATYVASQLMSWGIEPVDGAPGLVHEITTDKVDLQAPPELRVGTVVLSHGRDMLVRAMGPSSVAAPLVRYVPGVPLPARSVVLVTGPDAPSDAAVAQAVAVLEPETPEVRARWDAVAASGAGTTGRQWRIALDAGAFLALSRVADGSTVTLEAIVRPGTTWNVLGQIRGRDARRTQDVVLLSAHLDHLGVRGTGDDRIYNGADDDASGVTAVLELARVLAGGRRPSRTVLFAFFGSEEAGFAGSRAFVAHPPVPLDQIVANLQFEMIGRADPAVSDDTLWLTGFERSTLGEQLSSRGARLVADPRPEQKFFFRSDNIELAYRGVVAHTVSSFGLHDDYHTPADDLSGIDFPHMVRAIASLVEPVEWLVNSSFVPAWRDRQQPTRGDRGAAP